MSGSHAPAREAYDQNIEAIAVRVAHNFEVDRFRARVLDVSSPALARGYDLESYRPDQPPICIEVKGRAGRGPVHLTENQWPTAANIRERYLPTDQRGADLLFQVISARCERGSVVLTANKAFKQWSSIFNGDSTITSAVLDRLLHHAEVVVIEGSSCRMKDRIEG